MFPLFVDGPASFWLDSFHVLIAVSRLYEARTYTSPSVCLARIRALKWKNTQWNVTRIHLFQSYRLFCIHVFSVVACYIWRNTRGLTAELPLIIRPTRSWFSCPMAFSSLPSGPDANSNPAYPSPKILNKFKNHEDAENASAFSCWMSEESWDHLSQICSQPP